MTSSWVVGAEPGHPTIGFTDLTAAKAMVSVAIVWSAVRDGGHRGASGSAGHDRRP